MDRRVPRGNHRPAPAMDPKFGNPHDDVRTGPARVDGFTTKAGPKILKTALRSARAFRRGGPLPEIDKGLGGRNSRRNSTGKQGTVSPRGKRTQGPSPLEGNERPAEGKDAPKIAPGREGRPELAARLDLRDPQASEIHLQTARGNLTRR